MKKIMILFLLFFSISLPSVVLAFAVTYTGTENIVTDGQIFTFNLDVVTYANDGTIGELIITCSGDYNTTGTEYVDFSIDGGLFSVNQLSLADDPNWYTTPDSGHRFTYETQILPSVLMEITHDGFMSVVMANSDQVNDIYDGRGFVSWSLTYEAAVPEPSDLYSETVMGDNPFAYYRLSELAVTDPVLDEMGTHHGSCQNNPTLGVSGALLSNPANTAMCFDSSQSQYIELTTLGDYGSAMIGGFTVEYWLKTTDSTAGQSFLGSIRKKDVPSDPYFRSNFFIAVGDLDNHLRLYFRDDNWKRYGIASHRDDLTVDIFDGQWHHMVSVYDPTGILLEDRMIWYLDGTRQEVEVWIKGGIPSDFSFNVPMILAAQNFRGEIRGHFNGCLDEVAFYTRPLTEEEVLSHYQAATSADTDGDGIPDDQDRCINSDLSETVVIDGCDSGVDNMLFDDGCTISDNITELADNSTNHGKFASAVSHYTNDLKKDGVITGKQKGAIQSCAAARR